MGESAEERGMKRVKKGRRRQKDKQAIHSWHEVEVEIAGHESVWRKGVKLCDVECQRRVRCSVNLELPGICGISEGRMRGEWCRYG